MTVKWDPCWKSVSLYPGSIFSQSKNALVYMCISTHIHSSQSRCVYKSSPGILNNSCDTHFQSIIANM